MRSIARLTGALAITLAGCVPTGAPEPTADPTSPPILPSTLTPATATPTPSVVTLWVPPPFAPDPATAAGALLIDRLAEFEARHPGTRLDVRVKEQDGPAGLIETLRAAAAVAPSALPDVIALDPSDLAAAARDELVEAYPAPLPPPEAGDWYAFALEPATIDGTLFGVPSAAQTEILAFDPARFTRPPADWSAILSGPAPFLFPAADPTAALTISHYLDLEGSLTQEDGSPALDPGVLETVLTFYGSAYNAGVLPLTSRQYETAGETWTAFNEGRAASVVAPLEAWMADSNGSAAVPLPGREPRGVALAEPWMWAVVGSAVQTQEAAVALVEWLSDPFFLGPWTHALGMLPPNEFALQAWPSTPDATLVGQVIAIARPVPSDSILDVVGPALQKAVDSVLSGSMSPQEAALGAATEVGGR